jgi:hypothetical protein
MHSESLYDLVLVSRREVVVITILGCDIVLCAFGCVPRLLLLLLLLLLLPSSTDWIW